MSQDTIKLRTVGAARSDRRYSIGGSDARIIMGGDEAALLRLWREKRGRGGAARLFGELARSTRACHRNSQSALVRTHDWRGHQRCSKLAPAPSDPLDGCDARWHRREHW